MIVEQGVAGVEKQQLLDQRRQVARVLFSEVREANRALQEGGLSRALLARDSLREMTTIDTRSGKDVLLLGTASSSHVFTETDRRANTAQQTPRREFGFYIRKTRIFTTEQGKEETTEVLERVKDYSELVRFLPEDAGYQYALDMSYSIGQNSGVSAHAEEAYAVNGYQTLSTQRPAAEGITMQYAFAKPIREKGVKTAYTEMVKIYTDGGVAQAEIAALLETERFREELGRYNHYDLRAPRLVAVRVQSLARVNGEIDIPGSVIQFVWKDPQNHRHPDRLSVSYLGLEDSSEQKTANLLFDMLRANRRYRIGRDINGDDLERSERRLLDSLVVRVEGRRAHLLTLDGKELRNPVALARFMKQSDLDVTDVYSDSVAELYRLGLRFPEGKTRVG